MRFHPILRFLFLIALLGGGLAAQESEQAEQEAEQLSVPGSAHYATGLLLHQQGEVADAAQELLLAVDAQPEDGRLLLTVAGKLLEWELPELALRAFDLAVEPDPPDPGLLVLRAEILQALSRDEEASSLFESALEIEPGNVAALGGAVRHLLAKGEGEAALERLRQGAALPDPGRELVLELCRLHLSSIIVAPDRLAGIRREIQPLAERLRQWEMETPEEALVLADSLSLAGQIDQAVEVLGGFLERTRDPALQVRDRLARMHLQGGRLREAAQQMEGILAIDPDNASAHYFLGTIASQEERWEEAIGHYRRSLDLRPEFEPAYLVLSAIHLDGGNPRKALEVLQSLLARFPGNLQGEIYSGLAMASLRRYPQGLQHLLKAQALAAGSPAPSPLPPSFHFQLGAMYERTGRPEEAEKAFLAFLELEPDDPVALNYLGYMWADRGEKLGQASLWIQRALELDPDNAAILDSMGWVLYRQGDYSGALSYLKRSEELLEEPDPEVLDHLGDVLSAMGRRQEAMVYWERCLELEFRDTVHRKLKSLQALPGDAPR